jgi:hypothetical protein
LQYAAQIANSISVAVIKTAWVDLIDYTFLPPDSVHNLYLLKKVWYLLIPSNTVQFPDR